MGAGGRVVTDARTLHVMCCLCSRQHAAVDTFLTESDGTIPVESAVTAVSAAWLHPCPPSHVPLAAALVKHSPAPFAGACFWLCVVQGLWSPTYRPWTNKWLYGARSGGLPSAPELTYVVACGSGCRSASTGGVAATVGPHLSATVLPQVE